MTQDTWCCNSPSRGALFLFFAGPRPAAATAGSIQPLISEGTPLKKNGPRGPARGKGAKVSAGPPGAPPRDPRASPDHPTWWLAPPLGAYHGQGGEKNGPVRPLGAPTKSHSLIRKRPLYCIGLYYRSSSAARPPKKHGPASRTLRPGACAPEALPAALLPVDATPCRAQHPSCYLRQAPYRRAPDPLACV
jgi:hypothetical protein